jgi:sugar phosphate isomerase/epimerase
MSIQIGIQLYTVREHAAVDPEGTLRKIAEYGYKGVQFAGYYNYKARELKSLIDSLGLKAAGSHVGFNLFDGDPEVQIEYADTLGLKIITVPGIDMNVFTQERTFEKMEKIREAAAKHGIQLSFHNHYHEFQIENDSYKLDIFYKRLPSVLMELDTYWAAFAGIDPLAYMEQNRDRLSSIHIKDMKKNAEERSVNANIGEGCLDIVAYLKKAESLGVEWAFVEMDKCNGDELECAKISRKNLTGMGY